MKNHSILYIWVGALLGFIFIGETQAQVFKGKLENKFYVDVQVGYDFKMGGFGLPIDGEQCYRYNGKTDIISATNISCGKGINAGINLGYKITEKLAVELGLNYLAGTPNTYIREKDGSLIFPINPGDGLDYFQHYTLSGNFFRLNPMVSYEFLPDKKVSPYAKAGIMLGFGNVTEKRYLKFLNEGDLSETFHKTRNTGSLAVGANAAVGVIYHCSSLIDFFAEAKINVMSYSPNKGEIVKYTEEGVNYLEYLETYEKEIIYEKTLKDDRPLDRDKPLQQLKPLFPMSSFAVNLGVRFRL